ncbi:rab effector MyRIP isoform X2 [Triplophysa dalaica]|uniref:rab effector MyRIP isoform X2 n=1 Tax=Triplophysa dalaica TaxID=1582913 RepID=UPI0024DF5359|nr:rab effector MyRIP isoform X2 [Triplophysa dalaica]
MGRKLDLSGLTDDEAEHVLQVVQRDMQLRKTEETRLSEMKQALVEEGSRCLLLSRQRRFNERCCIRCCSPFTFLLNPKRSCLDCNFNVCKGCCTYSKKHKGWLCSACQRSRVLKIQSLEWFYNNVQRRFKRFGSAKVLKNLYRGHAAERGVLAELTEGSTYEEEGIYNEGNVYESDSAFYRQSEERSMAETISVALRVAEEAIDEAIAKAESKTNSQSEAHYLREHRGELVQELATTIVQKIVQRRRDLSEMQSGDQLSPDQAKSASNASLWRSHSAFCLLPDEKVDQQGNIESKPSAFQGHAMEMNKEGTMPVQVLPSWRSVDRLDNSTLQSPDGNWIAYQSTLLSRPSLLTKRKSLVYSALERESGVVSAYDEIGSETETESDGVWGAALQELRLKMSANKQLSYPESYSRHSTLPLDAHTQKSTADIESSTGEDGPPHKSHKSLLPFLKRKVPLDHRRPSSARRPSIMDVNFNPGGAESSDDCLEDSRVKRLRRRKKNKREDAEWTGKPVLSLPDCSSQLSDALVKNRYLKQDPVLCHKSDQDLDADASDTPTPDILSSGAVTPEPFGLDLRNHSSVDHRAQGLVESLDKELTSKLRELNSQVRETQLSSTEDELERLEYQIRDQENERKAEGTKVIEEATFAIKVDLTKRMNETAYHQITTEKLDNKLTSKLKELTSKVNETQLSSTEDELDRFEDQIEFDVTTQPIRMETLESEDNKTDNQDRLIQYQEKPQSHVEKMVEKAEEERSEKRPRDMVSEKDIIERNVVNETLKDITTGSHKQEHNMTDAQEKIARKKTEKTVSQRQVQTEERSSAEGEQSGAENIETVIQTEEALSSELPLSELLIEDGEVEFDKIIDIVAKALDEMEESEAYCGEGVFLEESEAEKQEMTKDKAEQETVTDGARHEMEDGVEVEQSFVAGRSKVVHEKETGEINKVLAIENSTVVETSKEILLLKDANSQGDALDTEKREQQSIVRHSAPSGQEEYLSPEEICKKYSAASLRSITTEVLKVLNATEDLIHGSMGDSRSQPDHSDLMTVPPAEAKRLDEQLSRLEENVYVAAGTVFGLEAELGDLEECARSICASTSEGELSHLEDQVASAAAQVQQSELQVLDIAGRIAALKHAGLNVAPQTQFSNVKTTVTKTQTIGSSRKLRRRLPAPPTQDKEA